MELLKRIIKKEQERLIDLGTYQDTFNKKGRQKKRK